MGFLRNKKIMLLFLVIIVVLISVLYVFDRCLFKNTIKNKVSFSGKPSQEELRQLSKEYFSDSFIADDEDDSEVSGGILDDYFLNVDSLYVDVPFKVAVEVENKLREGIDFYFGLVKNLETTDDFNIEGWYKENADFFVVEFGIFTYPEFKQILNAFQGFTNIPEIKCEVNRYAVSLISLDIFSETGHKGVFSIDIVLDKDNTIYYWGVFDEK